MARLDHDGSGILRRGAEDALARHSKPEVFNTDQGSQFTGSAFTGVLANNGIAISMDGKGAWRDPATPTVSPQKVSRSRCCFYFSTNVCADHSPTAASTTSQTQNTAHRASSKPHTTAPTKPSNKLSSCWQPPDRANINAEVALFESLRVRGKNLRR